MRTKRTVERIRLVYSSKIGKGPKDPDVPHRNDFRRRDELPFQEPAPKGPTMLEILKAMHKAQPSVPGVPASQPKARRKDRCFLSKGMSLEEALAAGCRTSPLWRQCCELCQFRAAGGGNVLALLQHIRNEK